MVSFAVATNIGEDMCGGINNNYIYFLNKIAPLPPPTKDFPVSWVQITANEHIITCRIL